MENQMLINSDEALNRLTMMGLKPDDEIGEDKETELPKEEETVIPDEEKGTEEPDKGEEHSEEEESGDDAEAFIAGLKTEYGIDDDDIDPSPTGISTLIAKAVEKVKNQYADFDLGVVKEFKDWVASGKNPAVFAQAQPQTDWDSIVIEEDNIEKQEAWVRAMLLEKGNSERAIKSTIEGLKAAGELFDEAQEAKNFYKTIDDKRREDVVKNEEQLAAKAAEEWKTVETSITSGKVGTLVIPEPDRKKFTDFIKPSKELSPRPSEKVFSELPVAEQTAFEYLLFLYSQGKFSFQTALTGKSEIPRNKEIKQANQETRKAPNVISGMFGSGSKEQKSKGTGQDNLEGTSVLEIKKALTKSST